MATKAKRDIGAEILDGLAEIKEFYEGKRTLRTHDVPATKIAPMSSKEMKLARKKMNMSQSVFAATLGLNKRTLERWERGDARPSPSTAILIRMAVRYEDTIPRIMAMTVPVAKRRARATRSRAGAGPGSKRAAAR